MAIDVNALLEPVLPDAPCGEDLEYDPEFLELEKAAERKPEQQFGDTIVPAQDPDWPDIAQRALALADRTKDLRVAYQLAQAALRTGGIPGFHDSLALIRGYLDRYWDTLHPQLDPDDDYDPTMRVNIIASLCNISAIINPLRDAPLVVSQVAGPISTRAIAIANATEAPHPGSDGGLPSRSDIEAAFLDCDLAELQRTADAIHEAAELAAAIEAVLTDRVGVANSTDMSRLATALKEAQAAVAPWLTQRRTDADEPQIAPESSAPATAADLPENVTVAVPSRPSARAVGAGIRSRDDVIRTIDELCRYYEQQEPSSPVPILLVRAKGLVTKDFMAILQDLVPEAVREVEKLRGPAQ